MIISKIYNVIEFRKNEDNKQESLIKRTKKLLWDYLIFIIFLPAVMAIGLFFYSPVEFWPVSLELINSTGQKGVLIFYVIVLLLLEIIFNSAFALALVSLLFYLFSLPLLKRKKRREEFKNAFLQVLFGATRLSFKIILILIILTLLI